MRAGRVGVDLESVRARVDVRVAGGLLKTSSPLTHTPSHTPPRQYLYIG